MLHRLQLRLMLQAVFVSLIYELATFGLQSTGVRAVQQRMQRPFHMHTGAPATDGAGAPRKTSAARGPASEIDQPQSYTPLAFEFPAQDQTTVGAGTIPKSQRSHFVRPPSEQHLRHADYMTAPFVMEKAVVTGPASAAEQAAFEATMGELGGPFGGDVPLRSLLHGRRRPVKYSRCPSCTIVTCKTRTGVCSGHCKAGTSARNRQLFTCSTSRTALVRFCEFVKENIYEIPVSRLEPLDSMNVTVPSPYIGCAQIAGEGSGCPARGTRGVRNPGGNSTAEQYEVQLASCQSTRYLPDCVTSPMYPLGVCRCHRVAPDGRSLGSGPCNVTELELAGTLPGPGERRVVIDREEQQGVTRTAFSDYTEPGDAPPVKEAYTVVVPAFLSGADDAIEVEMQLVGWPVSRGAYDFRDVYDGAHVISDDYYIDGAADSMGASTPEAAPGPGDQEDQQDEDRAPGFERRLTRWRQSIANCLINLPAERADLPDARFRVCQARQLRRERDEDPLA